MIRALKPTFLLSFLWLFGCGLKDKSISKNHENAANNLSIEFIRQPKTVLIVDAKPEYSWVLPKSSLSQTAYQIVVASSEKNSDNNIGDIWDSGKVIDTQSFNIEHNGNPLERGKTYYWKVKVWNEHGEPTEFSDKQSFKMGDESKMITTSNSFQIDTINPSKFEAFDDTHYLIDFGKDAFASMIFDYASEENDTLIMHFGEQLEGNKINRNPQGHIRYQHIKVPVSKNKHQYQIELIPDKRNTKIGAIALPDSFPVLMPFRYVEIENVKNKINANQFKQLAYHTFWDDAQSTFTSSDSILNQVWDLCKYSIKATTFAGYYVDGDRERIPYEADAYINQLSHYTTDREYAIARRTIEYFMENPTWPTEWQLHVVLMVYADYMYTGNTEIIETYYEALKHKTLADLRREDGLISSENATPEFMNKLGFKDPKAKLKDIVDWPPAQKDTGWELATEEGERDGFVFKPYNTVVNCFYFRNLQIMVEFAEIMNNQEDVKFYSELSEKVKMSINDKLFDEDKAYYVDGEGTNHASLHANMMALAFNIVPEIHIKSVANFIKSRGMACSVYGAQYVMEALYNAGESDYALHLMTSEENRSWYNMIKIGSTITLEAWDMKYKPNSDWNHAWGAVPANIIPRELWGIKPKTPGYTVATIYPQLASLKNSSIEVPTIHGKISCNYNVIDETSAEYTIEIPSNMSIEFKLSNNANETIFLNSKKVAGYAFPMNLSSGTHTIQIIKN